MALEKVKVKMGMGGSCGGKGRSAKTAILKDASKKKRRAIAKKEIRAVDVQWKET